MTRIALFLALLATVCPRLGAAEKNTEQEAAIAAIAKMKGRVEVDQQRPGSPVIRVHLFGGKTAGIGLAPLAKLPEIEWIGLHLSDITEADLEAVPAALRGKWVLVSTEEGGKAKNYSGRSIAFDDKEYRFYVGDLVVRKAEVTVDLSAEPAQMDQRHHFGPNKGKTLKCIFKLDGEMLTIASGLYDEGRPTAFDSSKPGCSSVTVWKQLKE